MRYKKDSLEHFWIDDKIGDMLEKNLKKDIKIAKKFGFKCVVVHLCGVPNKIGYDRLNRILKLCKKCDVPIAIENINDANCLDEVLNKISNPYLKFCYDSGHNHAFNGDQDYLLRYKNRLAALHLHDNLGPKQKKSQIKGFTIKKESLDMHTLNKYGTIDWCETAKQLAQVEGPINLDYELLMCYHKGETAKEVLKEAYAQACELEAMINKHRGE